MKARREKGESDFAILTKCKDKNIVFKLYFTVCMRYAPLGDPSRKKKSPIYSPDGNENI